MSDRVHLGTEDGRRALEGAIVLSLEPTGAGSKVPGMILRLELRDETRINVEFSAHAKANVTMAGGGAVTVNAVASMDASAVEPEGGG